MRPCPACRPRAPGTHAGRAPTMRWRMLERGQRSGREPSLIPEIDEALRSLLRSSLPDKGVEIAFDAPTRDWAARRNTPTVDAYLYDIREDLGRRERGVVAIRDERGIVVRRRQ